MNALPAQMQNHEHVHVELRGKPVFDLAVTDGYKARDALRNCLAAPENA